MKSYWTDAVVLRSRSLGEADRLVSLLSDSEGKIRATARGARRGRSSLVAGTQPFVYARYQLFRGRELDSITQVQLLRSHLAVRDQLLSFALASYAAEVVDWTTMERQPVPGVFHLLLTLLAELDEHPPRLPARALALESWFELHHLGELGYRPQLDGCVLCHRPLLPSSGRSTGDPGWWLQPAQGGLVCSSCRRQSSSAEPGVLLGDEVISCLRRWQQEAEPDPGAVADPSQPTGRQLAAALRMYVDYYVNHTIRSLPFLAELMGTTTAAGDGGGPRASRT